MSRPMPEEGAWTTCDGIIVDVATGATIAFVASPLGVAMGEAEVVVAANAALIAAAPDLLGACEAAFYALDNADPPYWGGATDALRDAMAKARGKVVPTQA